MQKLPDSEFLIMKTVWQLNVPVTAAMIKARLGENNEWKIQTVISLLNRLSERRFLKTEKKNERKYTPLITQQEYLKFETNHFCEQYHGGSFISLFNTLQREKLSKEEIDELSEWLRETRENHE